MFLYLFTVYSTHNHMHTKLLILLVLAASIGLIAVKQMTPNAMKTPSQTEKTRFPKLCGVNLSGAEFGEKNLPGKINTDYIYATNSAQNEYFAQQKIRIIRVPFRWERIQPQVFGELSAVDLAGLKSMIASAKEHNQLVILDLHNYGRYYNAPLTVAKSTQLSDVWKKLAREFKDEDAIFGYELMNEPHDLPEGGEGWAKIVQTTVTAIRSVDPQTLILIPGYDWQHPNRWPEQNAALNILDPENKLLYAAHQYFDEDQSGSYTQQITDVEKTSQRVIADVQPFIQWLAERNAQGILTEVGTPADKKSVAVLDAYLSNLITQPNIVGVVLWSAGPWWGDYPLRVDPTSTGTAPQLDAIQSNCLPNITE